MEGPGPAIRRERRIPTFDATDQLDSLGCSRYARKKVLSGNPHLDDAAGLFEDDGLDVVQTLEANGVLIGICQDRRRLGVLR